LLQQPHIAARIAAVALIVSGALPFGGLWYLQVSDAIGYAEHYSRSHNAVIQVYDESGKLIQVHRHKGDFKEP
jgi:hypothetical protein